MKKMFVSLVAGPALAASVLIGAPSATAETAAEGSVGSAAWPSNCSYGKYKSSLGSEGSKAICTSGGGQYRATVICKTWDGQTVNRDAPVWRNVGSGTVSYVFCPEQSFYSSSGIWTRQ